MKKGLEKGLHGFDAFRGGLTTKDGIETNHGAEKGHSAKEERDIVRTGPALNRSRNL